MFSNVMIKMIPQQPTRKGVGLKSAAAVVVVVGIGTN